MKKILLLICLMAVAFNSSVFAQTNKQKVAVYVTGDVEDNYKKVVGSKLVSGVTASDDYAAVERTADFLKALADEQEYQLSGAVNDNQIVKLGKQFGVRYVLVADITEIFESLFISARMIDVQTGQITGSTEANKNVSSMDGLIGLSNEIVDDLILKLRILPFTLEDVRKIGPYSSAEEIYYHAKDIPKGYHVATEEEMEDIISLFQKYRKDLNFPVYCNVITSDKIDSWYDDVSRSSLRFHDYITSAILLYSPSEHIEVRDIIFRQYLDSFFKFDFGLETGYIYLIKDK
ncbi:MAG: hypothetical protein J1E38_05675 [Paramuribaculum sp.]|nr:hypothetical protein [Paramuribaculum sp.]